MERDVVLFGCIGVLSYVRQLDSVGSLSGLIGVCFMMSGSALGLLAEVRALTSVGDLH